MFLKIEFFRLVVIWMTLSSSVTMVESTIISSLSLLFETFNPMSMVRFYEFNDKGYNITDGCIQDMFLYLDGLHRDIFWAVRLFDASGYYSGGIYTGNEIRHGNPSLCHEMNFEFYQNYKHPKVLNQSIMPFSVRMIAAKYKMEIENSPFAVNNIFQSACVPTSCSFHDLTQVMSYTQHIPVVRNSVFVNHAELVEIRILNGSYQFYEDNCFYVLTFLNGKNVRLKHPDDSCDYLQFDESNLLNFAICANIKQMNLVIYTTLRTQTVATLPKVIFNLESRKGTLLHVRRLRVPSGNQRF